jgi:hypothetical protein
MTDCIECGFPNPTSGGVAVCRNCATRLPDEAQNNKTALSASTTGQPKTGNAPGPPRTRVPLDGNKAKAWRWVAGISISIVIVFLAWSWWIAASLSSSDSQAEQNGAGWSILVVAVFVVFPAVAALVVGLINVGDHLAIEDGTDRKRGCSRCGARGDHSRRRRRDHCIGRREAPSFAGEHGRGSLRPSEKTRARRPAHNRQYGRLKLCPFTRPYVAIWAVGQVLFPVPTRGYRDVGVTKSCIVG